MLRNSLRASQINSFNFPQVRASSEALAVQRARREADAEVLAARREELRAARAALAQETAASEERLDTAVTGERCGARASMRSKSFLLLSLVYMLYSVQKYLQKNLHPL